MNLGCGGSQPAVLAVAEWRGTTVRDRLVCETEVNKSGEDLFEDDQESEAEEPADLTVITRARRALG